jgi:hypothetical protein
LRRIEDKPCRRSAEAVGKAWFAAEDEAQHRDSADKVQRRDFRNSPGGVPDWPIPVLRNIEKR